MSHSNWSPCRQGPPSSITWEPTRSSPPSLLPGPSLPLLVGPLAPPFSPDTGPRREPPLPSLAVAFRLTVKLLVKLSSFLSGSVLEFRPLTWAPGKTPWRAQGLSFMCSSKQFPCSRFWFPSCFHSLFTFWPEWSYKDKAAGHPSSPAQLGAFPGAALSPDHGTVSAARPGFPLPSNSLGSSPIL